VVDYIFRLLAFEYLGRTDLVHVTPDELDSLSRSTSEIESETTGLDDAQAAALDMPRISDAPRVNGAVANSNAATSKVPGKNAKGAEAETKAASGGSQVFMESMMGDAPPCDVCGHITVRNGTCYKCLNCGNSLGCS
jgi:ribonucleoside-diphosphate reductase alpha chain